MTILLEKAFSKASELPALEQNRFAEWILEELESEKNRDDLFAESTDLLDSLANDALAEFRAGKTLPIDDLLK